MNWYTSLACLKNVAMTDVFSFILELRRGHSNNWRPSLPHSGHHHLPHNGHFWQDLSKIYNLNLESPDHNIVSFQRSCFQRHVIYHCFNFIAKKLFCYKSYSVSSAYFTASSPIAIFFHELVSFGWTSCRTCLRIQTINL